MKLSTLIIVLFSFIGSAHAQSTFTTPPAGEPRPHPLETFEPYIDSWFPSEYDRSYGPCNMHETLNLGCRTVPRYWGAERCRCPKP